MSTGQKLGRYQIIREIARSNDIVYEAMDPSIGRRVALKELQLPQNLVGSAKIERIERFYREAKAAGALTHPNIVTIFEVGQQGDRHFIAMEFLEGQTLQDVIDLRGALPAREAVDIICQVLDALGFAHSHGVVHRDIKPANIQILPGGTVKLTDFGIARIMHEPSITQSGQIFGTPSYMSPEQITGKQLDGRSDLFSVAVVLFEALTGSKPFGGDSVVSITYNIMNQEPASPAGVPPGLVTILMKGLSKSADSRYQSAYEFADALKSDWQSAPSPQVISGSAPPPIFFPPGTPVPGFPPPGQPAPAPGPVTVPPTKVPRPPSPPLLTASEKSCLTTAIVALVLAGLVILGIYGISKAWEAYQQQAQDVQATDYVNRAVSEMNSGNYEQAIKLFRETLNKPISPKLAGQIKGRIADCWVRIANREFERSNLAGAQNAVQQALSFNASSGDALYLNGVIFAQRGDWDSARYQWEQALYQDPTSDGAKYSREQLASYYLGEGKRAENAGYTGEALEYYRQAADVAPASKSGIEARERIDSLTLGR